MNDFCIFNTLLNYNKKRLGTYLPLSTQESDVAYCEHSAVPPALDNEKERGQGITARRAVEKKG